jgi:hypothetical protein
MDGACVTRSTPAQFKLCGSRRSPHRAGGIRAGFGEHNFQVCSATPSALLRNGPGHRPGPFLFSPAGALIRVTTSSLGQDGSTNRGQLVRTRLDPEKRWPLHSMSWL